MDIESELAKLDAMAELEVAKAQERICRKFDKIVQAQLDAWAKRFHRHKFSAHCTNGALSFDVTPKIGPSYFNSFDYISSYYG